MRKLDINRTNRTCKVVTCRLGKGLINPGLQNSFISRIEQTPMDIKNMYLNDYWTIHALGDVYRKNHFSIHIDEIKEAQ